MIYQVFCVGIRILRSPFLRSYKIKRSYSEMSTFTALSALSRLSPSSSALFVCDVQEIFRPLIHKMPSLINRTSFCVQAATILEMPIVVTQQYPKAFGNTVEELTSVLPESAFLADKTKFSMCTDEVTARLAELPDVNDIIMTGIESHVCVMQTTLDLLNSGKNVHIVCDAVSSQKPHDRAVALKRMEKAGAILTTSECAIFDLIGGAKHPHFKAINTLIKNTASLENEFRDSELP